VWILFLAGRSHLQSWVWHDSQSLFEHTVETNPKSLAGLVNLGRYYAEQGPVLAEKGSYHAAEQSMQQAIALYEKAVRYWPDDVPAREGLANTHARLGYVFAIHKRYDPAIAACETALKINPNNADAARLLAQVKAAKERGSPQTMPLR
jgi:tetratricopeptide (TPR) repeat protein